MRESLLEFYKKWYSANIMTLTITGNHNMADLEKWTTEKFSAVLNFKVVVPDLADPDPKP